jgi:hypothetical protein
VTLEKLSDDDLVTAFRRAVLFHAREALRRFSLAIVERPGFADRPERTQAYTMLARTADNFEQALVHVEEGRQAALAAGKSCAAWDLMEIPFRFGQGQAREAITLVQHVQRQHAKEPGVMERLTQILVDVGLLRPDGTPAMPAGRHPAAGAEPAEAPAAAEPSRIWTPGDETGEGGGGKLWTPG